jgi:cbb3-type cytochrome oxidase maturation protein
MNLDVAFFVSSSALMTLIFLGFLLWGFKSGQFKDLEKTKFELFEKEKE